MSDAEAIVRAVAAREPMVPRSDDYGGDWMCGFCEVLADDKWLGAYDHIWADVEHREDCQWRRAREWVDGHEVATAPTEVPGS